MSPLTASLVHTAATSAHGPQACTRESTSLVIASRPIGEERLAEESVLRKTISF